MDNTDRGGTTDQARRMAEAGEADHALFFEAFDFHSEYGEAPAERLDDPGSEVVCRACGEPVGGGSMPMHLGAAHDADTDEYLEAFPGVPLEPPEAVTEVAVMEGAADGDDKTVVL